jgi:NitT/TauT family transport system substrate-binding protein
MRSIGLALMALLALCACSQGGGNATNATAGKTVIRFATDWKAEAEHGGFYEALATGEYARRGLDVRIIPGGETTNVPELIATGAAELGDGSDSFIVMDLANQNVPVKAVAAFMQKNPQVLMAHPGVGINSLADMKGHPILLSDAARTAWWPWVRDHNGLSDSQVRSYTGNNGPFILDPQAVQEGYVTSEPYTVAQQGHFTPEVFLLADQGFPSYAAIVLASNQMIANNPAAIRAFVEASAVGWREYLHGDPKPADALILKDNPDMTEDVLAQARAKMIQYGIVDGGDTASLGYGAMTDQRWLDFFKIASKPGTANYRNAFTLQFLPNPPVK